MRYIVPTNWQTQVKIFEAYGCVFKRQKGSHLSFSLPRCETCRGDSQAQRSKRSRHKKQLVEARREQIAHRAKQAMAKYHRGNVERGSIKEFYQDLEGGQTR